MVRVSARSVSRVIAWGAVLGGIAGACSVSSEVDGVFGSNGGDGTGGTGTTSSSTTSSSSSSSSSTTSSSSSTTSSSSSSSTTSSSTGGSDVVVYCNNAPCMPGEVCCFEGGPGNFCGANDSCPGGFIEVSCNEPADCPGQVCCGDWNGQTYTGVYCQDTCQGIVQCEGDPSVCAAGESCNPSGILGDGYSFCQ